MPDALVVVIIIVAIFSVLRGDVALRDVIKIGAIVAVISAVGLTILYLPSRLYETIRGRDTPTWLTITTALIALTLAFGTHLALSLHRPNRRRDSEDPGR